jgi:hypothetical protein
MSCCGCLLLFTLRSLEENIVSIVTQTKEKICLTLTSLQLETFYNLWVGPPAVRLWLIGSASLSLIFKRLISQTST